VQCGCLGREEKTALLRGVDGVDHCGCLGEDKKKKHNN
jgi:hypothetical protein